MVCRRTFRFFFSGDSIFHGLPLSVKRTGKSLYDLHGLSSPVSRGKTGDLFRNFERLALSPDEQEIGVTGLVFFTAIWHGKPVVIT
jgi:hypothetical protein